jgi:hypothetical protein
VVVSLLLGKAIFALCIGGWVVEGSWAPAIRSCSLQVLQCVKLLLQGKVILFTLFLCHCTVLLARSRVNDDRSNKYIALLILGIAV